MPEGIGYGEDNISKLIALATDPRFDQATPEDQGALSQGIPQPGMAGPTLDFRGAPAFMEGGVVPAAPAPMAGPGPAAGVNPAGNNGPIPIEGMQQEIQRMAQDNPEVIQQVKAAMLQAMQEGDLTPGELNMVIQLATAAAQNPQLYPQLRQFAIQQGLADESTLPQEYDQGLVFIVLLVAKSVQGEGANSPAAGKPPESFMKGGQVRRADPEGDGGMVPTSDNEQGTVPALLHGEEGILHAGVMRAKGKEFLDKLNEAYEQDGSPKDKTKAS